MYGETNSLKQVEVMQYDLLVTNGEIYSMENQDEKFSAMGIKDGYIRELFTESPPNPSVLAKKTHDVQGKTDTVADNLKDFFDNGLGLVTLSFIDREDIPVFGKEVIPQLR